LECPGKPIFGIVALRERFREPFARRREFCTAVWLDVEFMRDDLPFEALNLTPARGFSAALSVEGRDFQSDWRRWS
jgi:hypothetical protein